MVSQDSTKRPDPGHTVLVFDDTLEHEAWNETAGVRVVLFVDFVRPLPWPLSTFNQLLLTLAGHTPAVRNAQANARRLAAAGGN